MTIQVMDLTSSKLSWTPTMTTPARRSSRPTDICKQANKRKAMISFKISWTSSSSPLSMSRLTLKWQDRLSRTLRTHRDILETIPPQITHRAKDIMRVDSKAPSNKTLSIHWTSMTWVAAPAASLAPTYTSTSEFESALFDIEAFFYKFQDTY